MDRVKEPDCFVLHIWSLLKLSPALSIAENGSAINSPDAGIASSLLARYWKQQMRLLLMINNCAEALGGFYKCQKGVYKGCKTAKRVLWKQIGSIGTWVITQEVKGVSVSHPSH